MREVAAREDNHSPHYFLLPQSATPRTVFPRGAA